MFRRFAIPFHLYNFRCNYSVSSHNNDSGKVCRSQAGDVKKQRVPIFDRETSSFGIFFWNSIFGHYWTDCNHTLLYHVLCNTDFCWKQKIRFFKSYVEDLSMWNAIVSEENFGNPLNSLNWIAIIQCGSNYPKSEDHYKARSHIFDTISTSSLCLYTMKFQ